MEPSEGLTGSVISKCSRLLALEFSLPRDTDELIRTLYGDLKRLRAFYCFAFDDMPYRLTTSSTVEWHTTIMDVFYRADNVMDSILLHTQTATNQEAFNRLLLKKAGEYSVLDLLRLVSEYASLLLIRGNICRYHHDNKRPGDLVGIEKPRDALINMLAQGDDMSEPKKQTKVVSIVGIGGIGKTQLARVVYDQIQPQFECAAFLTIPAAIIPEMKNFLEEMIIQLGIGGENPDDETQLVNHIGSFLQNKRYLVVIDSLSDEDDWTIISRGFPHNDYGSRVITTTRMKHIAELCCSGHEELIYEVQRLGYLDSKKLFLKQLLGREVLDTSTHAFNGILKMCGGIPSTITYIATFLQTIVTSAKQCNELMNSIHSAWKQTSTVDVNSHGFEYLTRLLSITYFNLPNPLRDCLMYLAVHAKNGIIYRTTAVRKWIAEGFISECAKYSPEEVASRYFDELISRNCIQLVQYGNGEEIYKINYVLMYNLRKIAQRDNFGIVLPESRSTMNYERSVRLSIQCHVSEYSVNTEDIDLRCMRSITVSGPANFHLSNDLVYLRVLDLDGCKDLDNSAMDYICTMALLKYLSVKHTQVSEIPPEIGVLRSLETLDIRHSKISSLPREIGKLRLLKTLDARHTQVKELPKEIVQLPKLAHLYFGQTSSPGGVKLPAGSDQLKSVEALGTVDSREWSASAMEEISGLTGLREIEVVLHDRPVDKEHNKKLLSSIGECKKLEYLIIYGDYNPRDDRPVSPYFPILKRLKVEGRFMKVPRWIAQLTTLKKLDARVCELDQDDLEILGGLPYLSTLALELICIPWKKEVAITECLKSRSSTDPSPTEESSPAGFMSLEVFSFDCRVPWITFEQGAMPSLKQVHLKLYACPGDKFPSGLKNLDSLEKIIIQYPSVHASSCGVTKVVAAMREEASNHRNLIALSVNGYHDDFLPNSRVDETLNGTEIEEASNHGNPIELSVNADHEVLLSNGRVHETITDTKIEKPSNHAIQIELSVSGDHEVLLSNTRVNETTTGTEIKECY